MRCMDTSRVSIAALVAMVIKFPLPTGLIGIDMSQINEGEAVLQRLDQHTIHVPYFPNKHKWGIKLFLTD